MPAYDGPSRPPHEGQVTWCGVGHTSPPAVRLGVGAYGLVWLRLGGVQGGDLRGAEGAIPYPQVGELPIQEGVEFRGWVLA